jgi:hypothetical protein
VTEADRYRELLLVMHDLVEDPSAPDPDRGEPEAWLERRPVPESDAAALAELGGKRLTLYRRLVRRGLSSAIRVEIPRTASRLGARFDEEVSHFLDAGGPTSHYLRDVAFEFVGWAAPRWRAARDVADYLADLARHELLAFEVAAAPARDVGAARPELELDAPVLFDPAAKVARYDFAVHRLSAALTARDEPDRVDTVLLAYRDVEHDVRYLELTPVAARIVERLMDGANLGEAMKGATRDRGVPLDQTVLDGAAVLLSDLAERGVLLGAGPRGGEGSLR